MRVVSLTCSNTEIVDFLGLGDLLVGVDDHSDYPPDLVRALPRVGPDLQIDIEQVVALKPDLVLASLTVPGHEKVVESIERAGLRYLAPAPQSVGDVARDIKTIATALGRSERGERLAAEFERRLTSPARASMKSASPRVLVQWWPKPIIAPGALSWVQDLLERCGATNVLADEQVESRPLEDQEVELLDPDVIVVSWCGVEAHKVRPDVVLNNPGLKSTSAVTNKAVACVPEAWLGRPSPRLAWGLWALRRVVDAWAAGRAVPDAFASPDASARLLEGGAAWPDS